MADNGQAPAPAGAAAEESVQSSRRGLLWTARDLTFAAIGILGILSDEAGALYERSIERGQDDVRRAQKRLGALRQTIPRSPRNRSDADAVRRSERSQAALEEWRTMLVRLNLPTATDVHVLTQQVAELEVQIERLTKEDKA